MAELDGDDRKNRNYGGENFASMGYQTQEFDASGELVEADDSFEAAEEEFPEEDFEGSLDE